MYTSIYIKGGLDMHDKHDNLINLYCIHTVKEYKDLLSKHSPWWIISIEILHEYFNNFYKRFIVMSFKHTNNNLL